MQSPLITFVRVSSPMYWPSNLAEPCAHAMLQSPVPSRRPSPRYLSIPLFPVQVSFTVLPRQSPVPPGADVRVSTIKSDGPSVTSRVTHTQPGQEPAPADLYRSPQRFEGSSSIAIRAMARSWDQSALSSERLRSFDNFLASPGQWLACSPARHQTVR